MASSYLSTHLQRTLKKEGHLHASTYTAFPEDRDAGFLSEQLERATAACLTSSQVHERVEQLASSVARVEEQLESCLKLVQCTQTCLEEHEKDHVTAMQELSRRIRRCEKVKYDGLDERIHKAVAETASAKSAELEQRIWERLETTLQAGELSKTSPVPPPPSESAPATVIGLPARSSDLQPPRSIRGSEAPPPTPPQLPGVQGAAVEQLLSAIEVRMASEMERCVAFIRKQEEEIAARVSSLATEVQEKEPKRESSQQIPPLKEASSESDHSKRSEKAEPHRLSEEPTRDLEPTRSLKSSRRKRGSKGQEEETKEVEEVVKRRVNERCEALENALIKVQESISVKQSAVIKEVRGRLKQQEEEVTIAAEERRATQRALERHMQTQARHWQLLTTQLDKVEATVRKQSSNLSALQVHVDDLTAQVIEDSSRQSTPVLLDRISERGRDLSHQLQVPSYQEPMRDEQLVKGPTDTEGEGLILLPRTRSRKGNSPKILKRGKSRSPRASSPKLSKERSRSLSLKASPREVTRHREFSLQERPALRASEDIPLSPKALRKSNLRPRSLENSRAASPPAMERPTTGATIDRSRSLQQFRERTRDRDHKGGSLRGVQGEVSAPPVAMGKEVEKRYERLMQRTEDRKKRLQELYKELSLVEKTN